MFIRVINSASCLVLFPVVRLVNIADTVKEFSAAIKNALEQRNDEKWLKRVDAFLNGNSWDKTFQRMATLINTTLSDKTQGRSENKLEAYV